MEEILTQHKADGLSSTPEPLSGRRESTPTTCLLTSSNAPWHTHTIIIQSKKIKAVLKLCVCVCMGGRAGWHVSISVCGNQKMMLGSPEAGGRGS